MEMLESKQINAVTEPPIRLEDADYIQVNISGGKDSQTCLRQVVLECDRLAIPRSRIVTVHATFAEEWPQAATLAQQHAEAYGLEFHLVARRRKDGSGDTLLDYVERRGKWPDSKNRYCTSDFKRGPCNRVITELGRRAGPRAKIINVFGFRAQESPARAKKPGSWKDSRLSNTKRTVWCWLPIHHWTLDEVWKDIKASGLPHHYAYDLGMPRLACRFCIFAPQGALEIAGKEFPEMLARYQALEKKIEHTFQHKKPIARIQPGDLVSITGLTDEWNM